jgi:hypothetical protein
MRVIFTSFYSRLLYFNQLQLIKPYYKMPQNGCQGFSLVIIVICRNRHPKVIMSEAWQSHEIASADFVSHAMTGKGDAHNDRCLANGRPGEI